MTPKLSKLALGVGLIVVPSLGVADARTVGIDVDEQISPQRTIESVTQADFKILVLSGKDGRTGRQNPCVTDNGCRSCTFLD